MIMMSSLVLVYTTFENNIMRALGEKGNHTF